MEEKPAEPAQPPEPAEPPSTDQQEAEASEVPPKKDPHKAAGSLNPKERTAFYEAVIQRGGKQGPIQKGGKRNRS